MKKNILIRVDSSSQIGFGHVMRCLLFANKLRDSNVFFLVRDLTGNINDQIVKNGYQVIMLNSNDVDELRDVVIAYKGNLLVIDHYDLDYEYETNLKNTIDIKLLSFDDIYNQHYCDYVYNPNIYAKIDEYSGLIPEKCKVFAGEHFILIRDEFFETVKEYKNSEVNKIVICFGGADFNGMTEKVLMTLVLIPNLKITVVMSSANKSYDKILNLSYNNVQLVIDSTDMANILASNDLLITASSTMSVESLIVGIPTITYQTSENQKLLATYLKENGLSIYLGKYNEFEGDKLRKVIYSINCTNKINLLMGRIEKFQSLLKANPNSFSEMLEI